MSGDERRGGASGLAPQRPVHDFDAIYAGTPPWEIGRPQAAFVALAEAGGLRGRVLDIGCGTGEHALLAASLGLEATGVDLAPHAIARARQKADDRGLDVGSGRAGGPLVERSIVEFLGPSRLLLVLDNCEHLLNASGRLAAAILAHCPTVRVLATSREALALPGEQTWPLRSLELPAPGGEVDAVAASAAVRVAYRRGRRMGRRRRGPDRHTVSAPSRSAAAGRGRWSPYRAVVTPAAS